LVQKIVVKLDLHDNNDKRKAMKAVSTLSGIDRGSSALLVSFCCYFSSYIGQSVDRSR
jgi:hypothetical protein